jgi:hypothetical protein
MNAAHTAVPPAPRGRSPPNDLLSVHPYYRFFHLILVLRRRKVFVIARFKQTIQTRITASKWMKAHADPEFAAQHTATVSERMKAPHAARRLQQLFQDLQTGSFEIIGRLRKIRGPASQNLAAKWSGKRGSSRAKLPSMPSQNSGSNVVERFAPLIAEGLEMQPTDLRPGI